MCRSVEGATRGNTNTKEENMRKIFFLSLFFFYGCASNKAIDSPRKTIQQGLELSISAQHSSFIPFRIEQIQCALNKVPFFFREYEDEMPFESFTTNTTFPALQKENILSCSMKLVAKKGTSPGYLKKYRFNVTSRHRFFVHKKKFASISVLFLRKLSKKRMREKKMVPLGDELFITFTRNS